MEYYKRKITLNPRTTALLGDDGSRVPLLDRATLNELFVFSGVTYTGITGAGYNIVIPFKQRIKDLGIYEDFSEESNSGFVITSIVDNLLNR